MNKTLLQKTVEAALDAVKNAYAPYSDFHVGAAIATKDGTIYKGVNVENSSFGATVCAERTAVFSAVADGKRDFVILAVASNLNGKAVFPCGICRQVLSDFSGASGLKIVLVNSKTGIIEKETSLSEIFPNHFEF